MASKDSTNARLIELGRAFDAAWAYENLVWEGTEDVLTDEAESMCEEAHEATAAIVRRIEGIPARTLEGVKVKARVVAWCCGEISDQINLHDTTMERVLEGVLFDLLSPAA